ncbi:two-component sensor histidine kinase [Desulfovibrio sp. OttesenSCG-928-F20]|nr:two-component sensor histidine kinase [Desulfovibrio sp. OttesenSCG-928-F20]
MSAQQPSSLRLLPGPENLSARLAMFILAILLVGVVLVVLTALDMAGLAPVDMRLTFAGVVLCASVLLLLLTGGLWRVITLAVLRPLEQIRKEALQEEGQGLGQVAATMRELREAVHRTQAELDESNRNLRHVEKLAMVGKLAAGVAHGVRNPLTSVKLRLFSLGRSLEKDDKLQEDLAVIADAIKHVDSIVGSFLEFSRRPSLKLEQVSPSTVLDASLRLLESRLEVFPVTLTIGRKQALPQLQLDPERLREALLNILLNACEAMNYAGELHVEEMLLSGSNGEVYACIRVGDSGPGIPEALLPDIFTPFFSTKEQGTGLGLPIAKSILEEHGGDIEVESSPEGTAFSLLLPLQQPGLPRRHRADIAAPE